MVKQTSKRYTVTGYMVCHKHGQEIKLIKADNHVICTVDKNPH